MRTACSRTCWKRGSSPTCRVLRWCAAATDRRAARCGWPKRWPPRDRRPAGDRSGGRRNGRDRPALDGRVCRTSAALATPRRRCGVGRRTVTYACGQRRRECVAGRPPGRVFEADERPAGRARGQNCPTGLEPAGRGPHRRWSCAGQAIEGAEDDAGAGESDAADLGPAMASGSQPRYSTSAVRRRGTRARGGQPAIVNVAGATLAAAPIEVVAARAGRSPDRPACAPGQRRRSCLTPLNRRDDRVGKTFGNWMVDGRDNAKLRARALRLVRELAETPTRRASAAARR